jgi:hypothetical protein
MYFFIFISTQPVNSNIFVGCGKSTRAHSKIYKITKIKMGRSYNENVENKNHQKNNRMDSI